MTDAICQHSVLVDEFCLISSYSKYTEYTHEVNKHIEDGLGRNLADQCTNEINISMLQFQQEIMENLKPLLPAYI